MKYRLSNFTCFYHPLFCAAILFSAGHLQAQSNYLGSMMTIGDSITEGLTPGGYRDPLCTDLTTAGYKFNFVGTHNTYQYGGATDSTAVLNAPSNDGSGTNNSYTDGYSGAFISYDPAVSYFYGTLQEIPTYFAHDPTPNYVLLEIGTNDILNNFDISTLGARLDQCIAAIYSADPTTNLLLAEITPLTGTEAAYNPEVIAYNAQMPALVAEHKAEGQSITLVDAYDAISLTGSDQASDGIHPTASGDAKIAAVYTSAIESLQPIPEPNSLTLFLPAALLLTAAALRRKFIRAS